MAFVRKLSVVAAVLMVLLLSVELTPVQADCDTNGILNYLTTGCLADLHTSPPPGGQCCQAVGDVKAKINPTNQCMCDTTAKAAPLGVTNQDVILMITSCLGAPAVPPCLKT